MSCYGILIAIIIPIARVSHTRTWSFFGFEFSKMNGVFENGFNFQWGSDGGIDKMNPCDTQQVECKNIHYSIPIRTITIYYF